MQIKLFDRNGGMGAAEVKESALFYHFTVQFEHRTEAPVRVYVVAGLTSVYLGIPDRTGHLTAQIARKHLPSAPECGVVTDEPRGAWQPWHGELDGVPVAMALTRAEEGGCRMAMPEETAVRFPAWTASFEPVMLGGKQYYELLFDANGRPRLREAPPKTEPPAGTDEITDETAETAETTDGTVDETAETAAETNEELPEAAASDKMAAIEETAAIAFDETAETVDETAAAGASQ